MIETQIAPEQTRSYLTIPNMLSASRFLAAIGLLFTVPLSAGFWVLYAWCGLSDVIDGPIARHSGTASSFGSMLDTIGDSTLIAAIVISFFPSIVAMGRGGMIALLVAGGGRVVALGFMARSRGPEALHTTAARGLGIFLFACPMAIALWGFPPVFLTACALALLTTGYELTRREVH